ncbi:rna-directed dna polymerase from mobile element jockey- hypothetical protein [Limosa lapponica baueri]|uniref:Rna-directed dna polymerase from mobile element jockey-like n=1 Tax=Limosa lapponica baueri TaxID=1758121 RepID=A0A2I0TSP8_LIMLA|nr:rna-directed dna polymerase from mobile element jockey- hypothetical protein [Limosa lapponica baueri]
MSWEEYRDATHLCGIRKAKAQHELNLSSNAKNIKDFYRYDSQKRKAKESVSPLMSKTGKLVTTDEEKADVLNNYFASVFTGNLSLHTSQVDGPQDRDRGSKVPPTVRDQPLSVILEISWQSDEVPGDWKKGNIVPIFKNGRKEDLGIYRPVSLTSVAGKVMEQTPLETMLRHMEDREVIRDSYCGFTRGKSCLDFCGVMTTSVDKGRAMDVV